MKVAFHSWFKKRYKKIPINTRRQFDARLLIFKKNPFDLLLNNHSLVGDRNGQWSINITGDWRAIYIWRDKDTVIFLDIDTHSNLYG